MSDNDPTKPVPNDEKFKPQNVAEPGATSEPPTRAPNNPADTDGEEVARGSEPPTRNSSRGR